MGLFESIAFIVFIFVFLLCMIWPISVPLLIFLIIKKYRSKKFFKSNVINQKINYTDIVKDQLEGFEITDILKLKMHLFDIFEKFENAYNSLDYGTLYNLSTPKLYEMYHTIMVLNSKLGEKRIIKSIELKNMIIFSTFSSEEKQEIYTTIEISYIDYTENSKGRVLRGNPVNKITEKFEVIFVKSLIGNNDYRCPNCGANVKGDTCDYCNSKLIASNEFRIDSIKKIVF